MKKSYPNVAHSVFGYSLYPVVCRQASKISRPCWYQARHPEVCFATYNPANPIHIRYQAFVRGVVAKPRKVQYPPFYCRIIYRVSLKQSANVFPRPLKIKVNNENFSPLHRLPTSKVGKHRTASQSSFIRVEGYELSRLIRHLFMLTAVGRHSGCPCIHARVCACWFHLQKVVG